MVDGVLAVAAAVSFGWWQRSWAAGLFVSFVTLLIIAEWERHQ